MFSVAKKTSSVINGAPQKAAPPTFFKKAGEERFFGAKENPSFFQAPVQAKLTVSTPDDPQEKEADAVADKIMRMPEPVTPAPIQPLPVSLLVTESDLSCKEEEEVQAEQEAPVINKLQCKQEQKKEQSGVSASIYRCGEKHVDAKAEICTCGCNSHHQEKNIALYPSDVMRQSGRGPPAASIPFEQTLASSKGGGSAMPDSTREFMESRFNADFGGVRLHTDDTAVHLSSSVHAQAFAHGNDIYFNSGKFSPDSADGKTLLAHELTHTIQQGASKTHSGSEVSLAKKQISPTVNNDLFSRSSSAINSTSLDKNVSTTSTKKKEASYNKHISGFKEGRVQSKTILSSFNVTVNGNLQSSANTFHSAPVEESTGKETNPEESSNPGIHSHLHKKSFSTGIFGSEEPSSYKPTNKGRGVLVQQKTATGKNTLVQRWPSLGDVWDATGGKVVKGAKAVGGFVADVAGDVIDWTEEKLEALVNELAPGLIPFLKGDIIGTLKESIKSAIDTLTGGLFSQVQTEGLAAILQQLFGSAMGSLGDTASHTCSAIAETAGKLWAFVKQLTGPALEAFKSMAGKIGSFFSSVWNDFALPAWDAIKKFAGSAWTWIVDKANWLWDLTAPVRNAIGAAWKWVCRQFGIAWSGASSVIDWLKEKASQAWNWIKSFIEPVIGPLKVIGAILVMLSPAGPIILIYKGAPVIWSAIEWLATNFNKYVISTAKEYLHKTILPAISSGIEWIKGLIMGGFGWIKSLFDSLLNGISGVFNAIAGLAFFKFLQNAIHSIANGIRTAVQSVVATLGSIAGKLAAFAGKIWDALKPVAEMVRQLIMVAVLGPFAILDDGVWHTLNTIVDIGMRIPCVRELEGLMQIPWLMKQFDAFRKMMKGIYEIIKNPQPVIDDLKKAIGGLIAKVAPKAKAAIQLVLGSKNAHHLEGIMRHLEPKLTYLGTHWWEVVKDTGWDMLWPWPAFGKDCEQIWVKGKSMFSNFFHLHFSKGIDDGLAIFRLVNSIAGHLYGWFAIASVLIGTVIGGGIPGFWAGVGVAVQAGEVLLVGMLAAEGASIQKSVFDLGTGGQNEQEDEEDYEQISSSGLNLGIMGAMIVLGELAVKFGKSLLESVKGLFRVRGAPPEVVPAIPGETPKAGVDVPGSEPATPKGEGEIPSPETGSHASTEGLTEDITRLREKVNNPQNIHKVTELEFSSKYDVEVEVEEHTFRRRNDNGTWCRFSEPVCGIELEDVNAKVGEAEGKTPAKEIPKERIATVSESINRTKARLDELKGQLADAPPTSSLRGDLMSRIEGLERRLNGYEADIKAAESVEEISMIEEEIAGLNKDLEKLQPEINKANVPIPTAEAQQLIDQYADALRRLRQAQDVIDSGAEPKAVKAAEARRTQANNEMEGIETRAVENHNRPGSELNRLYDQIESLIERREAINEERAEVAIGQQFSGCDAVQAVQRMPNQSPRGLRYEQIEQAIGRQPDSISGAINDIHGRPTGHVRLEWEFPDGSRFHVDVPGPENSSGFEINRNPHAGINAPRASDTFPNSDQSYHLTENGTVVPSQSAPAHMPVEMDQQLRYRLKGR